MLLNGEKVAGFFINQKIYLSGKIYEKPQDLRIFCEMISVLNHELTHAYDQKNNISYPKKFKYNKITNCWQSGNSFIFETLKKIYPEYESLLQDFKMANYYLNKEEQLSLNSEVEAIEELCSIYTDKLEQKLKESNTNTNKTEYRFLKLYKNLQKMTLALNLRMQDVERIARVNKEMLANNIDLIKNLYNESFQKLLNDQLDTELDSNDLQNFAMSQKIPYLFDQKKCEILNEYFYKNFNFEFSLIILDTPNFCYDEKDLIKTMDNLIENNWNEKSFLSNINSFDRDYLLNVYYNILSYKIQKNNAILNRTSQRFKKDFLLAHKLSKNNMQNNNEIKKQ